MSSNTMTFIVNQRNNLSKLQSNIFWQKSFFSFTGYWTARIIRLVLLHPICYSRHFAFKNSVEDFDTFQSITLNKSVWHIPLCFSWNIIKIQVWAHMQIQNKIQQMQFPHKFHIYNLAIVLNLLSYDIKVSNMITWELPINIFF